MRSLSLRPLISSPPRWVGLLQRTQWTLCCTMRSMLSGARTYAGQNDNFPSHTRHCHLLFLLVRNRAICDRLVDQRLTSASWKKPEVYFQRRTVPGAHTRARKIFQPRVTTEETEIYRQISPKSTEMRSVLLQTAPLLSRHERWW